MAAGTLTVQGSSGAGPTGQITIGPITITGTQVIGEQIVSPLASGDNTFTVPTGALAALIVAPTTGTATLKLRTNVNSGDAGLTIHGGGSPTLYAFPSSGPPTSLIINASGAQTPPINIFYI